MQSPGRPNHKIVRDVEGVKVEAAGTPAQGRAEEATFRLRLEAEEHQRLRPRRVAGARPPRHRFREGERLRPSPPFRVAGGLHRPRHRRLAPEAMLPGQEAHRRA
ncbi:hypothetical protein [Planctomyces sp. SH-PL14]|uniref:hypothetical protein n=1 Tax=Planctomyces sp. SH-PL14 TaxID=1632864 RepID=UPI0009466122|nr:hypothetical protein [Planctomyces sp. SH-PL14]